MTSWCVLYVKLLVCKSVLLFGVLESSIIKKDAHAHRVFTPKCNDFTSRGSSILVCQATIKSVRLDLGLHKCGKTRKLPYTLIRFWSARQKLATWRANRQAPNCCSGQPWGGVKNWIWQPRWSLRRKYSFHQSFVTCSGWPSVLTNRETFLYICHFRHCRVLTFTRASSGWLLSCMNTLNMAGEHVCSSQNRPWWCYFVSKILQYWISLNNIKYLHPGRTFLKTPFPVA